MYLYLLQQVLLRIPDRDRLRWIDVSFNTAQKDERALVEREIAHLRLNNLSYQQENQDQHHQPPLSSSVQVQNLPQQVQQNPAMLQQPPA